MDILILGAGTAGTEAAVVLKRSMRGARITVVDVDDTHIYQPGQLFLPFGDYAPEQLVKPRSSFIPDGVELVLSPVDSVDTQTQQVRLADGRRLGYDQLVIATGAHPSPDLLPGFSTTPGVHHFYSIDAAMALKEALAGMTSGKLLVGIGGAQLKCPVAPLEFALLADAQLKTMGVRDDVEITFFTPLRGAFPRATCSIALAYVLLDRGIPLEGLFHASQITDGAITSTDGRTLEFDLLVAAPPHVGADFIRRSGLGDELGFIPVDPGTTQAIGYDNVWVLGDAGATEAPKAGTVATYQMSAFAKNIRAVSRGEAPPARYDGHANCFVESGNGKALLIDFNYEVEPLYGHFLVPWVGLPLLKESRLSHWAKLAFRYVYWAGLLRGHLARLPSRLIMLGKKRQRG
jgi:sulfide:quinone oxidoreductase